MKRKSDGRLMDSPVFGERMGTLSGAAKGAPAVS